MALTEKQKRFCDEYLIDLNATQAAIRAGYSPKGINKRVTRMMANDGFKNYIDKRMSEKEKKLIADQDEVLRYLTSVLRGESTSEELVVEGIGDGCSEARRIAKHPGEKEKLKAAELLGKRYGLYTDRIDVDMDTDIKITIDYGENDSG